MDFGGVLEKPQKLAEKKPTKHEMCLIKGYQEMSRINLSLAEEAVASDNEALSIAEQNLRSVKNCDS